ncbi:MAG: hypothetical protein AAFU79_12780, partial [Myxococcota bacterium]
RCLTRERLHVGEFVEAKSDDEILARAEERFGNGVHEPPPLFAERPGLPPPPPPAPLGDSEVLPTLETRTPSSSRAPLVPAPRPYSSSENSELDEATPTPTFPPPPLARTPSSAPVAREKSPAFSDAAARAPISAPRLPEPVPAPGGRFWVGMGVGLAIGATLGAGLAVLLM